MNTTVESEQFKEELTEAVERWNGLVTPDLAPFTDQEWTELDTIEAQFLTAIHDQNWQRFKRFIDDYESTLKRIVAAKESR